MDTPASKNNNPEFDKSNHSGTPNGINGISQEPIALIGIGCRFPGNANSPESFWQLLKNGVNAITAIPGDRWEINSFYDPEPLKPGKTYVQWGGFVSNIDKFDADFFGISPKEASRMDPQQRLLLEVAYEALEDAGLALNKIANSKTGVFIGISTCDYGAIQANPTERLTINAYTNLGIGMCIAANRISYQFDFHGPSFAVDTACSSSLVATHLACQSIWRGESSMALVGGVNAILKPEGTIGFSKAAMLSPDGRCKSFDADANGYVRSEGAGMVVLKPLSKALEDKDTVYAVIRGTATNQDGRTAGIALPNQKAQEAVLTEAYLKAGLDPNDVGYIEAHGTGTNVGDPIEVNALGAVLRNNRSTDIECFIGSVKTNIGHLEAASGIAGLIKAALCLKHRQITPNLHFETPNPGIPFEDFRFRVPKNLEPLTKNGTTSFLAGINSFGFGGANAHVILGLPPVDDLAEPIPIKHKEEWQALMLPISARSTEALKAYCQSYIEFLTNAKDTALSDICESAGLRKGHHDIRMAVAGSTKDEVIDQLKAFLEGENRLTMSFGRVTARQQLKMAFIFSGMGQQWWAMGAQLLREEPVFLRTFKKIDKLLSQYVNWSLLEEITASEEKSRINETAIAQPAIFALQVSLYTLWSSWGINPDLVLGHSVGEIAAAHISGVFNLEDSVKLIFHRSRLQQKTAGQGKMLAVGLSVEESEKLIKEYGEYVSIAAINSPIDVTLSGDAAILETIAKKLDIKGDFCKFLQVEVPYHSLKMEQIREEFMESLKDLEPKPAVIPLFSTITAQSVNGLELDVNYWWLNVRNPVKFGSLIETLAEAGCNLFLEIGAHPVLSGSINTCLQKANKEGTVVSSLRRNQPERSTLLGTLGKLYCLGYPIKWDRLYEQKNGFVKLPAYPWQREHFWQETTKSIQMRIGLKIHPLLGYSKDAAYHTWQNELNKQELLYLNDHSIQGSVIYPAAGYIEMAFAVARETFGPGPCVVEEIELHKALFLKDTEPSTVHFIRDPKNNNFEVFSLSGTAEKTWVRNVSGKIRPLNETYISGVLPYTTPIFSDKEIISKSRFYDRFWRAGMQYGPNFQSIEQLWTNDFETIAALKIPDDIVSGMDKYIIHPSLIDACFQVLLGTLGFKKLEGEQIEGIYLPVSIEKIEFIKQPGKQCTALAKLILRKKDQVKGNITVFDDEGNILLKVVGIYCIAIDKSTANLENYLYKFKWKLKAQNRHVAENNLSYYIPSLLQIEADLKLEAAQLYTQFDRKRYYEVFVPQATQLASDYIILAFRNLKWDLRRGQYFTLEDMAEKTGIAANYKQLVSRLLRFLEGDGIIKKANGQWEVSKEPIVKDIHQLQHEWKNIWLQFPSHHVEMTLFQTCAEKLGEVLTGLVNPLELIFPNGSLGSTEQLYQDSPSYQVYNLLAQKAVQSAIEKNPSGQTIRILEIGGGTGGMTRHILRVLPQSSEYIFTDITPIFLHHAEQKFNKYPFVRYQVLDIEKDPIAQGYGPNSFDLIFASDVLHATADLRKTLEHVKMLLASEGLLVLLEGNKMNSMVTLVFGLLKGWWLFEDADLRGIDPWIPMETWKNLLIDSGFTDSIGVTDTSESDQSLHCVVVAKGPVVKSPDIVTQSIVPPVDMQGNWLIFDDQGIVGQSLADQLTANGCYPVMIRPGDSYSQTGRGQYLLRPEHPEDFRQLIKDNKETLEGEIKGIIHLWNLNSPASDTLNLYNLDKSLDSNCLSILYLFQSLLEYNPEKLPNLFLVTAGAEMVNTSDKIELSQNPVWGLGRVMINEFPNLTVKLIDLSREKTWQEVNSLWEELWSDDNEEEVAIRVEGRYSHRLVRTTLNYMAMEARDNSPVKDNNVFNLEIINPGILENLRLMATHRNPPGPREVEIKIHFAALNFKDIMVAMGLLPSEALEGGFTGTALGMECSGIIVAKGSEVTEFETGDAVITSGPGTLRSYLTIDSDFVVKKPVHLSFEEAATIPIAFLTAYYSLHHLGRLGKGEKVLIHSATGGVGLAAVQIAQNAGAVIFATAGTPEKRNLLRTLGIRYVMDSRALNFEAEIMNFTEGKGVDIVLNSLAGEAIHKSIKVLSSYGRFIEIGKRDIYENNKLELKPFRNNLSYFAVDMDKMSAQRPGIVKSLMHEIMEKFTHKLTRNGVSAEQQYEFNPLPCRVFSINDIAGAFKFMAQAKHVGKVVIAIEGQKADISPAPEKSLPVRADGTYIVTGGLGGFGLEVSNWLAEHGAKHLVLMGRSGASSEKAKTALKTLEDKGVEVIIAKGDVTKEEDLTALLADIRNSMPPLRGIVHAAMVINDGLMVHLNAGLMRKVINPKILGAWNLHLQTEGYPLDFFILFSSFTSLIGTPGQANYVMGNSFLDNLAVFRRARGLPALTVNWGAVAGTGYVAENPEIQKKLDTVGVRSVPYNELLKILEELLLHNATQVGVARIDWQRIGKIQMGGKISPRVSHLVEIDLSDNDNTENVALYDALMAIVPSERQQFLEKNISEQLAKVLGTSASKLDKEKSLLNMGLDSLMAVEIGNRIQTSLSVNIPPVKFMEGITIKGMAEYIIQQLAGKDETVVADIPSPVTQPLVEKDTRLDKTEKILETVENISEEEVDALLKTLLNEENRN